MRQLPDLLRNYRKQHQLVQKELAALLGISREYYTRIERGAVIPSPKLCNIIMEKLHLTLVARWSSDDESRGKNSKKRQ